MSNISCLELQLFVIFVLNDPGATQEQSWCPWQDTLTSILRNQKTTSSIPPLPWSGSSSVPTFVPCPFFGFICTFLFAHTCPHRASRINLAELKIINPVVEEGVPLICAVAHLLTPSLAVSSECEDCHAGLFLLQRISFTCVCQGASGESSSQVTYLNKCT